MKKKKQKKIDKKDMRINYTESGTFIGTTF